MTPEIEKIPIPVTSRWAGLKIEKYLMPNEIVIYSTKGFLSVGDEEHFEGHVTNNRVMIYTSKGLIFKTDRLLDVPIGAIKSFKIVEEGIIFKKMYLHLNEYRLVGNRMDILELYRAIQSAMHK